jgi:hypothetical protein
MEVLTSDEQRAFPRHALVLPEGAGNDLGLASSCFHLDSQGKSCFTEYGAWLRQLPLLCSWERV